MEYLGRSVVFNAFGYGSIGDFYGSILCRVWADSEFLWDGSRKLWTLTVLRLIYGTVLVLYGPIRNFYGLIFSIYGRKQIPDTLTQQSFIEPPP